MTTCTPCGATWTGKRIEHCDACHETFTGTTAGDKHRVGDYSPTDGKPLNPRRCLTPEEMRAKGMELNGRGQWSNGGESPWATPVEEAGPTLGDTVTVGTGHKQWTLREFWVAADGTRLAALEAVEGFGRTSVAIDRLKVVTA